MKYILLVLGLLLLGCSEKEKAKEPVTINRFDKQLMQCETKEELVSLLEENPEYSKSLYRAFPADTAFQSHLYYIISHPETRKFYEECNSFYGDMQDLEAEFSTAFTNIKKEYPEFSPPKIISTFTGLENDVYVSDSLIIFAMDAFVGPKATFRPNQPNYILNRYSKPYLVPSLLNLLSKTYNKTDPSDNSLLADMLFFGKSFEFTKEMANPIPDSLVIGYTNDKLRQSWFSQDQVWAYFVERELLYEKKPGVKRKYIEERPYVNEISEECPGRIGQWLGWRIIQEYRANNPKVSLKELMEITSSQEILKGSKYRGQIEDYVRE